MSSIDGLTTVRGYLDAARQRELLAVVDALPWSGSLKRRVQHYGYQYDYGRKKVDSHLYLGPLPGWAAELATALRDDGRAPHVPDQVIVNEYLPGQGIAPHVDCVPCFGGTVLSISLGSQCLLAMSRRGSDDNVDVLLEPGCLFVMAGEARYDWLHGIAARKSDRIGGVTVPRGRRVSLTFRTVLVHPPV